MQIRRSEGAQVLYMKELQKYKRKFHGTLRQKRGWNNSNRTITSYSSTILTKIKDV